MPNLKAVANLRSRTSEIERKQSWIDWSRQLRALEQASEILQTRPFTYVAAIYEDLRDNFFEELFNGSSFRFTLDALTGMAL